MNSSTATVLPGGAQRLEGDAPKKRVHRKVRRTVLERAANGGFSVRNEYDNPSGQYPPLHEDESFVFGSDDFHTAVVPHLARAHKVRQDDGEADE